MKRPIEADYTSHVAYTRALEAYCDLLVKSEQEPVAWMCCAFDGKVCEQSNHDECENPIPLYTAPPAQPEQKPYGWIDVYGHFWNHKTSEDDVPLYTTPPKRAWVELTDAEAQLIYDMGRTPSGMMEMVEAKLKEKNT